MSRLLRSPLHLLPSTTHLLRAKPNSPVYSRTAIPYPKSYISQIIPKRALSVWPYIYREQASPTMAPNLDTYFKTVDSLAESFIERLRKAVAIPSVSAEEERRGDVVKVSLFKAWSLWTRASPLFLREQRLLTSRRRWATFWRQS